MDENVSELISGAFSGMMNGLVIISIISTIIMIVVPALFVILIIWMIYNERQKRRKLQAEIYIKSIEKGLPVQKDLFMRPQRKPLHTGIILISSGIAIMLLFWLISVSLSSINPSSSKAFLTITPVGLLPLFVGIAHLIIHFLEKNNNESDNAK